MREVCSGAVDFVPDVRHDARFSHLAIDFVERDLALLEASDFFRGALWRLGGRDAGQGSEPGGEAEEAFDLGEGGGLGAGQVLAEEPFSQAEELSGGGPFLFVESVGSAPPFLVVRKRFRGSAHG